MGSIGEKIRIGIRGFEDSRNRGIEWAFHQKIIAPDGQTDDIFGGSVDLQGAYAVVAAQGADVNGNVDQGSAYVFKRVADIWSFEDKVVASDGASGTSLGQKIALDGDRMVVASWITNAVYIYKRTGASWSEEIKLVQSDPQPGDWFGQSVDISGNYVIVGAWGDDTGPILDGGSAYLFKYSGLFWEQQHKIIPPGVGDSYGFGAAVAMDGDYIIIGSTADVVQDCSTTISSAGMVWIYKRSAPCGTSI